MTGSPHPEPVEALVARAREGDRGALERLMRAIQDDVYNLALRMLWQPADAEDATQDILLKVFTHLGMFRGEAAFRTWVYRIAANHLLRVRRSAVERATTSFEAFGADLTLGLAEPRAGADSDPDQALLVEEVKIGCTMGMLLCLDRDHRIAYVLGDVFGLSGDDAATVLEVPAATFRKRLSRARARLRGFMRGHCGLVSASAACRCARRVEPAIAAGRVTPGRLLFAGRGTAGPTAVPVLEGVAQMEDLHRIAAIHRDHPRPSAPGDPAGALNELLRSGRYGLLDPP